MTAFKGYDYEELLEPWGLQKKADKIRKHLWKLNRLEYFTDDEWAGMTEIVGIDLIKKHIEDSLTCDDDGLCKIKEPVRSDMISFLAALVCGDETNNTEIQKTILSLARGPKDDDFAFYSSFLNNIEGMWN